MSAKFKDRHLLGAGAAACAVCCAPPLLALLGIAGTGAVAALATAAFAGIAFGLVVLAASLLGIWAVRRRARATGAQCGTAQPTSEPVEVTISTTPPDQS